MPLISYCTEKKCIFGALRDWVTLLLLLLNKTKNNTNYGRRKEDSHIIGYSHSREREIAISLFHRIIRSALRICLIISSLLLSSRPRSWARKPS